MFRVRLDSSQQTGKHAVALDAVAVQSSNRHADYQSGFLGCKQHALTGRRRLAPRHSNTKLARPEIVTDTDCGASVGRAALVDRSRSPAVSHYSARKRNSTKLLSPLFMLSLFATGTAAAQTAPAARGVGVGAEATLTGIVGGTFVYDAEAFHIDALLGGSFQHNDSALAVAGRLFFPVHRSQSADFSLGPGIGFVHTTHDPDGDGPLYPVCGPRSSQALELSASWRV